jgi:aspartate dehydrogenase
MTAQNNSRIGIIGAGRIARAVMAGIEGGEAGAYEICGVLVRKDGDRPGVDAPVTTDRAAFLATAPELIIEAAGPAALAEHGVAALAVADIWSISGMALGDAELAARIEAAGRQSGHRLRLLGGAIAGLDAAAIAARDKGARMVIEAVTDEAETDAAPDFEGSARDAVNSLHGVNVVAAAAIAGTGLDATRLRFFERKPGRKRFFNLRIESQVGSYFMSSSPNLSPETGATQVVAASVITALAQAQRVIWAG